MCQAFASMADLVADDEVRSRVVMDWIQTIKKELMMPSPSSGSNVLWHHAFQLPLHDTGSQNTVVRSIGDPKQSKKKGTPKKLRRKSPLEMHSKKTKVPLVACIRKKPATSHSGMAKVASHSQTSQQQRVLGDEESYAVAQYQPSFNMIQLATTNVMINSDGNVVYNYYPHAQYEGDTTRRLQ
ncbi:uncharacterized protein LOC111382186 [Olea europaea var. sylvestris]|uniref:uncharacterized protein LOC111382186 n=1 Tax=Olea europaea var. sylvestris TaxID=158386 RepID=UPI000C1D6CD7|nr:uncharacterized protein LOC111382186 [Olea europaea var. sylvestris]XP_022861859.1 uncharacterized protein LOC111382186 [Olea europaea var. sylvestris]